MQFVCRLWHIVHMSQSSVSQSRRMHAFSRLSVDGGYIPATYASSAKSWTQQQIEKPLSAAVFLGSVYWDKDPSMAVFNLRVSFKSWHNVDYMLRAHIINHFKFKMHVPKCNICIHVTCRFEKIFIQFKSAWNGNSPHLFFVKCML